MLPFRRPHRSSFTRLLVLLGACVLAFAQWRGWIAPPGQKNAPPPNSESAQRPSSQPSSAKNGEWEQLADCRLVEERSNDGDSFLVTQGGQNHTLRLYFADCPEKHRHQYNGQRIAEQGRYFGGLSEEQTVGAGEAARDFSLGLLRKAPFNVLTRWERVYNSERFYGFVTTAEGDLAEGLVARGLARIYTKGENRPQGRTSSEEKARLSELERTARQAKLGAWGKHSSSK